MSYETRRLLPLATCSLVAINLLVFAWELTRGARLDAFLDQWALVPADILAYGSGRESTPAAWVTLLTAAFLHAGWFHLATNMLYLTIFGLRLERAMGSGPFVVAYLVMATTAGLGQVVAAPDQQIPALGASGAISGVVGAYLALNLRNLPATFAPRYFHARSRDLAAAALLVLWLIAQLATGALTVGRPTVDTMSGWWAHGFGLMAGITLGAWLLRSQGHRDPLAEASVSWSGWAASVRHKWGMH